MLTKILKFSKLIFIPALFLTLLFSFTQFNQVETLAQIELPGSDEFCNGGDCPGGVNDSNVRGLADENGIVSLLINIANFLTFIAGGIAVLFMVWGGIRMITANGSEDNFTAGKTILLNATYGLIVAIVSYTIVLIISQIASGNFLNNFFG